MTAYRICFLEVEDQVQLAHIAKVPVENLDVSVDDLQRDELVVGGVDGRYEKQGGIATVDDLRVCSSVSDALSCMAMLGS